MPVKIGFLGAGKMATALAKGFIASDDSCKLVVFDPNQTACQNFQNSIDTPQIDASSTKIEFCETSQNLFTSCEILMLAVKPQNFLKAVEGIHFGARQKPLVVSVMAGVSIRCIQQATACDAIVRIMTNTPCLIGQAASAMACSNSVSTSQRQQITGYMQSVGIVEQIDESLMDAVTGLAGSGPAFVFEFIESLVQAGLAAGLTSTTARNLAIQTILGSADLVRQTKQSPANLRDQVASPGGTTIAGLKELYAHGFKHAVIEAVEKAASRARELGKILDAR